MREGGAFLLIVVGLVLGYFAVKGKLSCITAAFACAAGGSAPSGGSGGLASGFTSTGGLALPNVPGLTVPTFPATTAPLSA